MDKVYALAVQPARKIAAHEGRSAVSAEIRALMGRHRVTQTALADYLGMSQSALSERLNGRVPWDIDDLDGIAERFGVTTGDLVRREAAHNPRYGNFAHVVTEVPFAGQMELFGQSAIEPRSLELVKA